MSERHKGDLADPELLAEQEKARELRRLQESEDLRSIAGTDYGRRFLHRLIYQEARVLHQSFTGNSATFFNEGRRSVGLKVLAELTEVCPSETRQMLMDNIETQLEVKDDHRK